MRIKSKKIKIILVIVLLLGLFIFFCIAWGFHQEPRRAQERQRERIREVAEKNPEAAEKHKLWREQGAN